MNERPDIRQQLIKSVRWQLTAFSAGCASRIAPIVRRLACRATIEVFDLGLEIVWMASRGDGVHKDVRELLMRVKRVTEAKEDDSDSPLYYPMRSLGVLNAALRTVASETPLSEANGARYAAADICSGCDFILAPNKNELSQPIRVLEGLPPTGPCERRELDMQLKTITELNAAGTIPNTQVIEMVHRVSRDMAAEFDLAVAAVARKRYGKE